MPESSTKRVRAQLRDSPRATRAQTAPDTTTLSVELGAERLAFLAAECAREYWQSMPDAVLHLIDLRLRAHFRDGQRRALARVGSLMNRELYRLANRSADADAGLAVRRVVEQIGAGSDALLKHGLRLWQALEAGDRATYEELARWQAPEPPARRQVS